MLQLKYILNINLTMEQSIYLELVNERHHKFYELTLIGQVLRINYGRIGRTGKVKIFKFPSSEEAINFYQKQIHIKNKKGYEKARKGLVPPRAKGFHPGQLRFIWE
jgi:predicted DNA-binding WGR domain protein